jgi:excinuclease ABC subunit C
MDAFKLISKSQIDQLPKTAGVYCFTEGKQMIYIGKAINIKSRVKNHFQQPSYRDDLFIEKVDKVGFIETHSEIEALILEANLIKHYQPRFNVVWRDDKHYFYVAITKGDRPMVFITHQQQYPKTVYIGPFIEGNSLKKTLKFLRNVFPYYTSSTHPKQKCQWCHLDLCPGPDLNIIEYKKNIKKLQLILEGKRGYVLRSLKKEMAEFAKQQYFEKAQSVRDKMYALQNVMAHTNVIGNPTIALTEHIESESWHNTGIVMQGILNVKKPIKKIECYDISNIQGKYAVGSMVVFINGKPDKNQYKKFKIRMKQEPNDIAMLQEMLQRRLGHPEWKYPDVMLIDGGIAQLNAGITAKSALPAARKIKVISIAKGKQELVIEGQKKHIPLKNLPQRMYNVIVHLDDEAHRFAITYHKKLRKRALLDI